MNVDCKELEKLLSEGISELPSSVASHLRECPSCAKEWEAWQEIAEAAPSLRKAVGRAPELWPRIRQSLEAKARRAGAKALVARRIVSTVEPALAGCNCDSDPGSFRSRPDG
jgi:predicted anti-sigma-YlaC factor YlaD